MLTECGNSLMPNDSEADELKRKFLLGKSNVFSVKEKINNGSRDRVGVKSPLFVFKESDPPVFLKSITTNFC